MPDFDFEVIRCITDLTERCRRAEAERDALAAHADRLHEAVIYGRDYEAMIERAREIAIDESPTTSLARLKAGELESLLSEGRHSYDAETIRAFIRNRLNRLRRQAEEAS